MQGAFADKVEGDESGEAMDTPSFGNAATLPSAVTTTPAVAPGQVFLPDTTGWDQSSGLTTGAETLQLEVDILSAEAVDRIAYAIANRVAAKATAAKVKSVTVVSPGMLAALRLHAALEAEVGALEAMTERIAATAPPDTLETTDATAFSDLPFKAADAAQRVLKSASSALSVFASSTAYTGRKDSARQSVLDAALAKHIATKGLGVELPERALPATEPRGLLARILELRSRCNELGRKGANLEDLLPISGALDDLHKLVFGPAEGAAPGAPLAQQLMLADTIARGLTAGRAVLFAEIAFSGGSYRTRKWIFNTLFGRDGLTYSGGAGVTYFLFRADDRSTLDSDTLYFTSPHGRFDHVAGGDFKPTNLNG
jgi:hypothetical protein